MVVSVTVLRTMVAVMEDTIMGTIILMAVSSEVIDAPEKWINNVESCVFC